MNKAVYENTMENLRIRINVNLVNNEKDYMRRTSKPSYMSQKILDNDLVVIYNSNVTETLNKPAYVEFHYDCIKNKNDNNSRLLFIGIDSLMYKIKKKCI